MSSTTSTHGDAVKVLSLLITIVQAAQTYNIYLPVVLFHHGTIYLSTYDAFHLDFAHIQATNMQFQKM